MQYRLIVARECGRKADCGRRSAGFRLLAARVHARIWADLAATGLDVGAHDRLVAATAITVGWRVGPANLRHFDRISGLDIVTLTFTR